MNYPIKKVLYRRPDNRRTVPAFVLCENGELTLLFVPCNFETRPDFLLIAHDDDCDGVFEDAEANWFNVSSKELLEIAKTFQVLGISRKAD